MFARIAGSEQRHMDAAGALLARYGLGDPVAGMPDGRYADAALNHRYQQLVAQGNALRGAYAAGVSIEEADIADLTARIAQADNIDIDTVFGHLLEGSRHHLAAFSARLGR